MGSGTYSRLSWVRGHATWQEQVTHLLPVRRRLDDRHAGREHGERGAEVVGAEGGRRCARNSDHGRLSTLAAKPARGCRRGIIRVAATAATTPATTR